MKSTPKHNDQAWYSDALDVLGPLRWHINELIEEMESHNRFCSAHMKNVPLLSHRKITAAKQANDTADKFFSSSVTNGEKKTKDDTE